MDDPLLQHLWMRKPPDSFREVLASFNEGASTAELIESVGKMFHANPKSKMSITGPFTKPTDSIAPPKEQTDHTSQKNAVLKHIKNARRRSLDHLTSSIVGITSILVKKPIDVSLHATTKHIVREKQKPVSDCHWL